MRKSPCPSSSSSDTAGLTSRQIQLTSWFPWGMQCHHPPRHRRELQAWVPPLPASQPPPHLHEDLGRWLGRNATLAREVTLGPTTQSKSAALVRASGYLHRMQPCLGTSDSFHSCHGNMVQGANGGQAGIGRKVTGTQIKVIPSTTQVIRADLGAGSGRSVMPVSLLFTLYYVLFYRCPHLSTQDSAPEPLQRPVESHTGAP